MNRRVAAPAGLFLLAASVAIGCGPEDGPRLLRLDGSSVAIAEVERRVPELMAEVWLPGLSVVVVRDGSIAYRQSFGTRDAETGEAITRATSFTGLSFSKTITAYLVMRLVDRGVLDLDRPLHTYLARPLPEYDDYADLGGDSRYRTITARHVLSHQTGWPNWRWFTDEGTLEFLFDPGTRHSYSGEGFAYLQLVLEELTDRSFTELAGDQVFRPLGMEQSSMVWQPEYESDYAEDHDLLGRPMARERWDRASAAGSLQTTIGDYMRFLIAVMNADGLEPGSREQMLSPQIAIRHARMFGPRLYEETTEHEDTGLAWTLGWGRVDTPYGWAVFHTGNDRGSANYTIAFPERRAAVVLMGNSNRLEGIAEDLVALLTADRSSPFAFLGYDRWDGPRQRWLRTLAEEGTVAGRDYWRSLDAERRRDHGLDDEDAFRWGGETLAHFRSIDEAVELQDWRRELFPDSAEAIRDQVKLLIGAGRADDGVTRLEQALGESPALAGELDWFAAWARTVAAPAAVPNDRLALLAGEYEVRRFELRDGRLFYGRDATMPEEYSELLAMSDDTFVLESADFFRLRFELDVEGRAVRVHGLYEGGRSDSNERSDDGSPPLASGDRVTISDLLIAAGPIAGGAE